MQITSHAYIRSKERFGWKRRTLRRMSRKVFIFGTKPEETKSKLNKYINTLKEYYPSANNVRIYGENIFFFHDNVLITLYRLPNELIKYVKI